MENPVVHLLCHTQQLVRTRFAHLVGKALSVVDHTERNDPHIHPAVIIPVEFTEEPSVMPNLPSIDHFKMTSERCVLLLISLMEEIRKFSKDDRFVEYFWLLRHFASMGYLQVTHLLSFTN